MIGSATKKRSFAHLPREVRRAAAGYRVARRLGWGPGLEHCRHVSQIGLRLRIAVSLAQTVPGCGGPGGGSSRCRSLFVVAAALVSWVSFSRFPFSVLFPRCTNWMCQESTELHTARLLAGLCRFQSSRSPTRHLPYAGMPLPRAMQRGPSGTSPWTASPKRMELQIEI